MAQKVSTLQSRKAQKRRFIFLFLLPTLVCFFLFYFYSVATIFITSFTKWDYTNLNNPQFLGFDKLFENYRYIFEEYPFFQEALFNSIRWAIIGVVIQVPLALTVAIALSKKLKGWKLSRNLYIIPSIISSAAMGLIFLQIYNPNFGVVNQVIRLFNPDFKEAVLLTPGLNIVAMTCAYIFFAGASTIMLLGQRKEWYITIPMIKETIKTVSVMAATSGFLLYNEVFFLTNGAAGTKSISFIIRELAVSSSRTQYARANTIGVIQIIGGMLIILCINLIYRDNKKSRKGKKSHE